MTSHTKTLSDPSRRIDDEMQAMMDQYLPGRKPISPDNYDWDKIRPETLDEDFLEALAMVTLVESNPKDPAQKLLDAADRSEAPWLRRFITQTWLPEEGMHAAPFREYLIRSGAYDQVNIDFEIDKVVARGFVHGEGYSEVKAATYGWMQELITWRFYDSMRTYLLTRAKEGIPLDPVMSQILADIARQENFHRHIYLSGVRTILKHQPQRKKEVIEAVTEFVMPGHHMAPELQAKAPAWSVKFGFQLRPLMKDLISGIVEFAGHNGLGQASIQYGAKNAIQWYFKPIVFLLAPAAKPYRSPINYLAGRFISKIL